MNQPGIYRHFNQRRWGVSIASAALLLAALISPAFADEAAPTPLPKGQRVYVCGHSFHVFIEKPLAMLAKEAGYSDHVDLGVSFIGGSTPMQHWNSHAPNCPREALATGNVEVLTLAPHRQVPEEGIEKFADLAIEKNPNVRVFLQVSWAPYDGHSQDKGQPKFEKKDHDKTTLEELHSPPYALDQWVQAIHDQAAALNKKHGKEFVYVVPVNVAVLKLREKIIAGQVPGIKHQSDLFDDGMGHPSESMKVLITYVWFAAIYHKSPVGLKALLVTKDPTVPKVNDLLQEIAWEAAKSDPACGVVPASK